MSPDSHSNQHPDARTVSPGPDAAEELPDEARGLHPIRLVPFVAVVIVIDVVDLVLTFRLHKVLNANTALNHSADIISWTANIVFAALLIFAVGTVIASRRKTPHIALPVMVTYLSVATVNVLINIGTLVVAPNLGKVSQNGLILDLALSITAITLVYSLWYQIADTHLKGGALDFPPNMADPEAPPNWFDYLAVSFFTTSTFGPTLEGVRTRPAKAIMMSQTGLSLIVLVVLVARIVKTG